VPRLSRDDKHFLGGVPDAEMPRRKCHKPKNAMNEEWLAPVPGRREPGLESRPVLQRLVQIEWHVRVAKGPF
jgi:hypothetical protein